MAFQYPVEIPGVSNHFLLQTSVNAVRKYRQQAPLDRFDFSDFIEEKIALLKMPADLLTRSVNVGFSGGEKKRNDILQMAALEPSLCILDETDSGLDIDALKSWPMALTHCAMRTAHLLSLPTTNVFWITLNLISSMCCIRGGSLNRVISR